MENQKFTEGQKVVLKNNKEKIYVFIEYVDEKIGLCLSHNNETVKIHVVALEPYEPPQPYAGGAY